MDRQPHPMLLAARELLVREVKALDQHPPVLREDLEYAEAVTALCDALDKADRRAVMLFIPDFILRPEDGGYVVAGHYHAFRAPDGIISHRYDEISWHHWRWTARRAAKAWLKRAWAVSERIAAELEEATR